MASLQEQFEAGFASNSTTFKKPSVIEVLTWSERWAHQLGLWGGLEADDIFDHGLTTESRLEECSDSSGSLDHERTSAEMNNFSFRSVQHHPGVRKEANLIVDNLLQKAGASKEAVSQLKQVLPYKIALLHHLKAPRQEVVTVPVWIWKRQINPRGARRIEEDLLRVFVGIDLSFEDLLIKLYKIVHPGQSINLADLLSTTWEYVLLDNPESRPTEQNSGFIRRPVDWKTIKTSITLPWYPYVCVLVFQVRSVQNFEHQANIGQRDDMYIPHKPIVAESDTRDLGMAKLESLIQNAEQSTERKIGGQDMLEVDEADPSSDVTSASQIPTSVPVARALPQSNESLQRRHANDDRKESLHENFIAPKFTQALHLSTSRVSQTISIGSSSRTGSTIGHAETMPTVGKTRKISDGLQFFDSNVVLLTDVNISQSKYVAVWLEHDGISDRYFDYPTPQPTTTRKQGRGKRLWN